MIRIRQLDCDARRDVRQFVRFPFDLYRDCPQWVPPLLRDAEVILNARAHPFYEHSVAAFFLAERDGETAGRIAVMDNRRYNEHYGSNTAFFGYLELEEDAEIARLLIDAACSWARARGLDDIQGSSELNGAMGGGVLVEGFEHRPAVAMPYNHRYYDALLSDAGFAKLTDYLSGYLSGDDDLSERFYRISEKVKARYGLWIKSFDTMKEIRSWVPRIAKVYAQAFAGTEGFCPPTAAEARMIAETLMSIAIPDLVKLVMKGDEIVGFIFCYPDVSAGLQRARGRLWPVGWYHILRDQERTEWANVNGLGVLPEYQGRGASIMLYTELAKSLKARGFRHIDIVQVNESNLKSKGDMETIGVRWYKRHRKYRRPL